MNRVSFGEGACEKTRKYMDSYLINELLIETNHEVLRHLDGCPECAAELNARARLRTRLKAAVNSQAAPPELQVKIRKQLQGKRATGWSPARWSMAMAAGMAVCGAAWWSYRPETLPALADRPAQAAYIQRVSTALAAVLKVGLADHIHCSIFRKYPQNSPTVEEMETKLGPYYRGLLPVLQAAAPDGYRVVMAHQCSYAGRQYIHLTLKKGSDLLSLVVAKKGPEESMSSLPSVGDASGIPIYQSEAGRYRIAGFEAGGFLAYVISDLGPGRNLQVAVAAAPGVHSVLARPQA